MNLSIYYFLKIGNLINKKRKTRKYYFPTTIGKIILTTSKSIYIDYNDHTSPYTSKCFYINSFLPIWVTNFGVSFKFKGNIQTHIS